MHPNRQHETCLGRSERSEKAKISFRDIVDVEKAKRLPVAVERVVDWTTLIKAWPMFLNDELGDCTVAGGAHGEQIFSAAIGKPFTVTNTDVLRMYEASGYKPGHPETDQGWTLQVAADYLRKKGLQGKPNIVAYTDVELGDEDALQVATELFGGLYVGAAMPKSAQTQYQAGKAWVITDGGRDEGSWGGHCMWRAQSMLGKSIKLVTWGGLQEAHASWVKAYVDEQMALVPADWQTKMPEHIVQAGVVDFTKLDSLLAQFTSKAVA